MNVRNFISADDVLRVFNLEPPSPSAYVRFMKAYWKGAYPQASSETVAQFSDYLREWQDAEDLMGAAAFTRNYLARAPFFRPPPGTPDKGWRLPGTISRKDSRLIAEALVSSHIRSWVDGWLDTGRERDGSEWPFRRNLHKTPHAWQAASEFIDQSPPRLVLSAGSGGFELVLVEPNWHRPWAEDFFKAQEIEAKRLFVGILASEWQQRLCKCRYPCCGRYFMGVKLRPSYRHGTFCSPRHREHASAEAITKARRHAGRSDLIEAAAQWLCQQAVSAWQDDVGLKRRLLTVLAKRVSRNPNLRPSREPVRQNWITRNCAAIERRRLELSRTNNLSPIAKHL
jgi:hypothetical protein